MPSIDIPLSADLQKAFDLEPCEALGIPMPSPLKVTLPSGAALHALTDMSKGIPNDCSMSFNLMVQIAPFLAAIECPLKMLKLLKPLVDVITGLAKAPPEPPTPELIGDVVAAAAELSGCFLMPANLLPMCKDILCLIRAVLNCLMMQLKSVRDLMSGLQLRLEAAQDNEDLLAAVECAQKNGQVSMQNLTQAIEPVSAVIGLLSPILEMAGMPEIQLTPQAPPEDLEALDAIVDTLQAVVDAIDDITGGICAA
jgi:hypothetical protein